ncbi:X-X-X-Leu-X-X-Gly heptad repeat protein [Cytobacillus eiseniae]|uniref:X-X-X-Leu-X-X-Gly heptad repeat protein n=1 Tax=Cytobacillus eiseniae TaxID=762947 RepID=A0ABS4RKU7_9BACI|nr:hypothetical protein [Cytobacillus eiseniae]MBP2242924.1 X-X-X-Leu-X-X-Gly heptad repeat protein [Cytobacillus eiseniae]
MRRMRTILFALLAGILVLPSFLTTTSANDSKQKEATSEKEGEIASKDEVVYATLSATGERQEIYVVNTLEVKREGKVVDYGSYSSLKNLTDLANLEQMDQRVHFTASEGKFYYQGNMNEEPLPWEIAISYFLDGKKITPEELAGKDGHVEIQINTSANEKVNPVFYENYLLQISLPLDSSIFTAIKAPSGMIANAGKNKQVTFTVMPEKAEELVVEADVVDFELAGIDITGVPSSISIDLPDVDEMTGEMKTLADAIADVNKGVAELNNGVSQLNSGVGDLRAGSVQYKNGITDLDQASSALVNGSKDIEKALETMSHSLGNAEGIDVSGIGQLAEGLTTIANGLGETTEGLATLKQNYKHAYRALDQAMTAIPSYDMTDEQLEALKKSNANQEVVGKLIETYIAARTAKATYTEVKQGFDAVDATLQNVIGALTEMRNHLATMAKGLASSEEDMDGFAQLQQGISALSASYKAFHSGIVDYTDGVSQLSSSYEGLHDGIVELSGGTEDLEKGVSELHDGTNKLHESTSDLPNQMTTEIDQMISTYDKSDFDAVSFVSAENEKVNSVQFVLKTESIKSEESEKPSEPVEEKKGFWARLIDLFK